MDLLKVIAELRKEQILIDEAIQALERLVDSHRTRRYPIRSITESNSEKLPIKQQEKSVNAS